MFGCIILVTGILGVFAFIFILAYVFPAYADSSLLLLPQHTPSTRTGFVVAEEKRMNEISE